MFEVEMTVRLPDGGEHRVTAEQPDLIVWERTSKGKRLGELLPVAEDGESVDLSRLSLVEIVRLAHITCRRLGLHTGDLATFEADSRVILEGGDQPDPTAADRSDGSLSPSRSAPASRPRRGRRNRRRR